MRPANSGDKLYFYSGWIGSVVLTESASMSQTPSLER